MHTYHTLLLLRQHAKPHTDVGNAASQRLRG
ncbi:hypothetical protein SAMN05216206_0579 [Pseudomonas guineae]|uniref:Uncharacterized protein n=1 Tax=Pseudomonas guineae TaxID=425504 RepID=A0A1I3DKV6_9PSED|nr:hypothetical protein SAMN05216206_0579 [Pseudomonas guineae]